METANELLVKINTISCKLDELGCNRKLITREIFGVRHGDKSCKKATYALIAFEAFKPNAYRVVILDI